jgi:ParB family chromosome partitioning protein
LANGEPDVMPDFEPVSVDEQGRLDEKKPIECPECGHHFTT